MQSSYKALTAGRGRKKAMSLRSLEAKRSRDRSGIQESHWNEERLIFRDGYTCVEGIEDAAGTGTIGWSTSQKRSEGHQSTNELGGKMERSG